MPRYSILDVARIWIRNGGTQSTLPFEAALAIMLAESGGNSDAIGPAGDYGLWQINRVNFAHFHVNSFTVLNPDTNARIAIAMSSNGYNWAPWCTAWADPRRNCGHGLLRDPEGGSAAYAQLPRVVTALHNAGFELRGTVTDQPEKQTPHTSGVTATWADTQRYQAHGAPKQYADLARLRAAFKKVGDS